MQPAVIIQPEDWADLCRRLSQLEAAEAARTSVTTNADARASEVLPTAKAAAEIGLSADALLRARRAGRLTGVRLNEKDWGFTRATLEAYPRRYHRAAA